MLIDREAAAPLPPVAELMATANPEALAVAVAPCHPVLPRLPEPLLPPVALASATVPPVVLVLSALAVALPPSPALPALGFCMLGPDAGRLPALPPPLPVAKAGGPH